MYGAIGQKLKTALFRASGPASSSGLVPAPSLTVGTQNFLREDATWAIPPNDILSPLGQAEIPISGTNNLTIGRMHVCSGSSAYTVTLPAPASCTGKLLGIRITNTNLITVSKNSSELIDGVATRIMWKGESAILLCDGTNWYKIAGKSLPMTCRMYRSTALSLTSNVETTVSLNVSASDNTGLMADTSNGRVKLLRIGSYVASFSVQFSNIAACSIAQAFLYNAAAAQQLAASMGTINGSYPTIGLTANYTTTTAGDYLYLTGYQNTGAPASINELGVSNAISVAEIPAW